MDVCKYGLFSSNSDSQSKALLIVGHSSGHVSIDTCCITSVAARIENGCCFTVLGPTCLPSFMPATHQHTQL